MPGKIPFVQKFVVDVITSPDLEIKLDGNILVLTDGQYEIIDDNQTHTLAFNMPVANVWIENISVQHLIVDNTLTFTTPIYRWLLANIDNK
jgi:hypothetical protein